MRRLFGICCFIAVCCTGCAGNGQDAPNIPENAMIESSAALMDPPAAVPAEPPQPEGASENDLLAEGRDRYIYYMELVQEGIKASSSIYNAHLEDPAEILEIRNVYGFSEQGSQYTKFKDADGNAHRYYIESFGETGRSIRNYYACGDSIFYMEELVMTYTIHLFHGGLNTNVKTYDLTKYVFDGDELYLLDDVLEVCIPHTEDRKPSTWQTVEERFEARGEPTES